MKAAILHARRDIRPGEVPDPRPGPEDVVVRVEYASVCGTDYHVYLGEFEGRVNYPAVLGHEFAGVVEELGAGVDGLSVGDRVAVDPDLPCGTCPACRDGHASGCQRLRLIGIDLPGGFAEKVLVPAGKAARLPEGIELKHAALLELYSVAVHAVRRARIDPADVVVLLGAGKLGTAILQVARHAGAKELIAVDVSAARLERARRLGATHVIDAREEDPVRRVADLTAGEGADRVIEAVGAADAAPGRAHPLAQAIEMVRNAGRVVVLGQSPQEPGVPWRTFVWKEAEIVASRVSHNELPRAVEMLLRGMLSPGEVVTHELPASAAARAFELLEHRDDALKILLKHDWR